MAQLFRKHEMRKDFEKKYENDKLSLQISNSGTVFEREIPCFMACFYFDPKHSLETVVDSVSPKDLTLTTPMPVDVKRGDQAQVGFFHRFSRGPGAITD